jgi:hypothetical protein
VDLRKANTGELIRVEEALQSATAAAKEVVSLRLRRRNEREQRGQPHSGEVPLPDQVQIPRDARDDKSGARDDKSGAQDAKSGAQDDKASVEEHRIVRDERGTPWAVVAVYPSARSIDQKTLPERFAHGWLLFEHGDEVRRYAPVPEEWQSLSDADLRSLCQNAEVATKRITPLRSPEEKLGK